MPRRLRLLPVAVLGTLVVSAGLARRRVELAPVEDPQPPMPLRRAPFIPTVADDRPVADPHTAMPAAVLRLGVVIVVLATIAALRILRSVVWTVGVEPTGWFQVLASFGAVLWALPAIPCAMALGGALVHGGLPPASQGGRLTDPTPMPCPHHVCFRIVSRGRNADALRATVASVRRELAALPLFAYSIEAVTDVPVELEDGDDLRHLVVPPWYETTNGSRYKARALQFAVERSDLPDDAWLFHLDEESHLSPSVVIGIRDAIVEEETSGAHRIGQGAILYHRHLHHHPFLTLADMIRTGDDLSRFHLQHRLGFTIFGLHGSFILVRNSIERRCDFDFGPEGSITEDAFWALRQMALGSRCRWVDGFVVEQSTERLRDFVKQRRRWFAGLLRVVLYAETKIWVRLPLAMFVGLWSVSWLGAAYTIANLFLGLRTPPVLHALADLALATYVMNYLVGLHVNLRERPVIAWPRRAGLYLAQLVLVPAFTVIEAAGVLAGMLRPERGFHVVDKSAGDQPTAPPQARASTSAAA